MYNPPATQDETESTASCWSGMQSRLSSLLGRRRPSTSAQPLPSSPVSLTATAGGNRANHAEGGQSRPSAPYVPQHAAATFSRTATPRQMRKENEIFTTSVHRPPLLLYSKSPGAWANNLAKTGAGMDTSDLTSLGDEGAEEACGASHDHPR
ncbi:hypothetical protein GGR51DRAFT_558535 [Nemania sp. FL0031]|nr:hypothetical protein GGR51DRAFT_558535 [Nemania sp. FL0031]